MNFLSWWLRFLQFLHSYWKNQKRAAEKPQNSWSSKSFWILTHIFRKSNERKSMMYPNDNGRGHKTKTSLKTKFYLLILFPQNLVCKHTHTEHIHSNTFHINSYFSIIWKTIIISDRGFMLSQAKINNNHIQPPYIRTEI